MKRLMLLVVTCGILVACAGGNSKNVVLHPKHSTSVVLHPRSKAMQGIYVQVTGSPKAAPVVARMVQQSPFGGALVAAPAVHGRQVCARTARIVTYPVVTEPSLRGLGGQKISFAVDSDRHGGRVLCQLFFAALSSNGTIPLLGGNQRISRVLSPSMEPNLHCAYARGGCLAHQTDLVVVQQSGARGLQRNAIVLFNQTQQENQDADVLCEGEGGAAVRRLVGLPGETVREDTRGYISIRSAGASTWTKLGDWYIPVEDRATDAAHFDFAQFGREWHVPAGEYFVMSDNRSSCDSRTWGSVPAANIIGSVSYIVRGDAVLRPAGTPS